MCMAGLTQQRVLSGLIRCHTTTLHAWARIGSCESCCPPTAARRHLARVMAHTTPDRVHTYPMRNTALRSCQSYYLSCCCASPPCQLNASDLQVPNRVAVGQMTSTGDHAANLATCRRLAEQARNNPNAS